MANPLAHLFSGLKSLAKQNPALSRAVYNLYNRNEFNSLYEHEKMLGDRVRVDTYARGIEAIISDGAKVIDLGTGTGVLAMLAARKHGTHIYALDHSSFIEKAEKIARANGFDNISFHYTNSRKFTPPQKVDIVLHEQIGDDLFEENMVENLLDLKARALKPGGLILPGRFQLFATPVALHTDYHVPFIWEKDVHGLDFSLLKLEESTDPYDAGDYVLNYIAASACKAFLCDPKPIMEIDLNTISKSDEIPSEFSQTVTINSDENMDGLCIWFRTFFNDEISFDTSPFSRHTHWAHRLYRTPTRPVKAGQSLKCTLRIPQLVRANTWSFEVEDA